MRVVRFKQRPPACREGARQLRRSWAAFDRLWLSAGFHIRFHTPIACPKQLQSRRWILGQRFCLFAALILVMITSGAGPASAVSELDYGLTEHRVARIELHGNETFPTKELKSILQIQEPSWMRPLSVPRYRPDLIDAQLRLLERYYQRRGFHQVAVSLDSIGLSAQGGDIIYISLQEGPRTIFAQISFTGGGPFSPDELRKGLQYLEGEPAPVDLNDLGRDLYILRSRYWEKAYLGVVIEPVLSTAPTEDPDRYEAYLEYLISPGHAYQLRQIHIAGQQITRLDLITRELRVTEGEPFYWEEVEKSRRNLLDTALFRDVSFTPTWVDTAAGLADLTITVVERKPAFYELGFGVGSRERVRILAAWGHNNLFGSGRRLSVNGRVYWNVEDIVGSTNTEQQPEINYRADLIYINPHLRGSRFRLDTNLYARRETRGASGLILDTIGFAFGTTFRGGLHAFNTVALQLEENDPRPHPDAPTTQQIFAENDITRSQTRSVLYGIFLEKRNNLIYPVRGSQASVQLELAGGLLGGDNSFLRGDAAWHTYVPTPLGGVLAFRLRLGAARPYGDSLERGADGVPYERRFFAGGASSVRGYLERSLGPQASTAELDSLAAAGNLVQGSPARGGNYLLLSSLEWRFPLPLLSQLNFAGVIFLDAGNTWESSGEIRLKGFRLRSYPREASDPLATQVWDYRYSLGFGLRFNTPVGPFRVDVGYPLKRAQYVDENGVPVREDDRYIYHFSLGYPF